MNPAAFQAYVPQIDLASLVPFLVLLAGAIGCLVFDAFSSRERSRQVLPWITGAALLASIACFFTPLLPRLPFLEASFHADEFGRIGCLTLLVSALMMTLMAPSIVERRNLPSGEFYSLILFAAFGMTTLAVANELLTAFVCLEIMSLSLYVLTGIDRRSGKATEASFKYFVLGAFASAFLVFGIAFLFGATHTTRLDQMAEVFRQGGVLVAEAVYRDGVEVIPATVQDLNPLWVFPGFALLFVGICFKLSLAPFHMYAPDVYEGSNTPTTMVIATGSKIAALALLVHVVQAMSYWPLFEQGALVVIGFAAIASMLWGNLAALAQSNIKRMLAYSSVAHTGYVTVGVLVLVALPGIVTEADKLAEAQQSVREAMIFYMAGYTLMNILAFGIAHYIGGEGHMAAYRGLVQRQPLAAAGMAVAMFSLLGIPPTVGFMGKFYLFREAVQYGFAPVAVIGVLASVISAFYYLSLVVTMFMKDEEESAPTDGLAVRLAGVHSPQVRMVAGEAVARLVLALTAALILIFGILPTLFFGYQQFVGGA